MIFRTIDKIIDMMLIPVKKLVESAIYETHLGIKFDKRQEMVASDFAKGVISRLDSSKFVMEKPKWINSGFYHFAVVSDESKYSICFEQNGERRGLTTYECYLIQDAQVAYFEDDDVYFLSKEIQKRIDKGEIEIKIVNHRLG